MRTEAILAFLIALLVPIKTHSIELSDLIGVQRAQTLRSEESIKNILVNQVNPSMVPNSESGSKMESEIVKFGPNVIVEALYFYKKPPALAGNKWSESEKIVLFNLLRSLSTLSGIEYYSASRGAMRVFYEKSYVVDGPDGREALPDPVSEIVVKQSTLYSIQKDLTFGENRYRYDYFTSAQDLSFTQTNLTHMSYGIIPLIGKEALQTSVLVSDTSDGYLLYAVSAVKAALLPGIDGKMKTSFSNRADAIYRWFSQRADTVINSIVVKK